MPFYKILKFFLPFFLWINVIFSQNYLSKNLTAANELPNNSVKSLLIDSNNVLWIGTENGVVRRENDVYKYFFEEDGLALNSCWAIAEDKNQKLWFGSYGEGVSIYDGYSFEVISKEDGLVHNEITTLFQRGNYMYIGTSDGLSIVNINTLEILSSNFPQDDKLFRVQDFFEYEEQVYVVTYRSGVYQVQNEDELTLVKVNDHKYIYSVFVDEDSIYSSNKGFFTKRPIAAYVRAKDSVPAERLGRSIIWDYAKTKDNKIYVSGWGIYDSDGGIYEIVDEELVSRASEFDIPSNEVISLAYDPNFEKLYVGTKDVGLFEISLNPQIKFQNIEGDKVLEFARTENTSAVLMSEGIVLKSGGNKRIIGLHQLKCWQENYILITDVPLPKHEDDFYELDYSTKAEDIRFYDIKTFEDAFWVNTNIGIFAIKDSGKLLHYLPLHSEEINFTPEGNLIETNPYGGVRIYHDLDALEYIHYPQSEPQTPTMIVNSLGKGDRTYFLSVFSGLYTWEKNRFRSYMKKGIWEEKKLKHITSLGDKLAVSNEFGDVFIINDQESFQLLKKIPRAKIQGNTISFLEDYKGTLIVGTEKGLTLFKNDRSIFLNKEQGLEAPLFSAEVYQNNLLVGSKNGYYSVNLDAIIETAALIDKITLKEISVNNKNFSVGSFTDGEDLILEHDENTVLLKFSTNAHPYPNKLTYQYKLNAVERWSIPIPQPEIFLPALPTGDYEIQIKVRDQSTGFSYTESLINIAVLPPFWKTWWFILLAIATVIVAVYQFYKHQIRQNREFEKQKGLIQKRLEETKMEALLSQMNPHFIFNAMNSIQYYVMDRDIDNATKFLADFAKLIRMNLDHCTKPTILLIEETEYLQLYCRVENTRFNNAIKVVFEIDPSIDLHEVEIPTMLLQTFVENVFVHAFPASIKNPTLKVSFNLISVGVLQCNIEDNGMGFSGNSKNKFHDSKGITLVKERLTLLGYDVEKAVQMISTPNKGTSVILTLQV